MSTARRLALAVAFILTRYASGTAASVITERENAPGALAAYSGEATVPLDSSCSGSLYASRVTPSETWDIALAREVDEFAETHPSLRVAEKEAETWLAHHPEMMKLNSIIVPKRHVEYPPQLGGSFFNGSADSRPQSPILRDVVREGDHWLVAIECPSHQIATLVINDHDQLVDPRLETRKVPQ